MSTISEVQVERAIVHIVNLAEPTKSVISQYELPLFSNVHLRSYFEEQIAKVLVNPAVSKAVFNVNALSPGSPANLCFAAMKDPKNFLESSHVTVDKNGDGVAEGIGKWASLSTKGAESTGLYFDRFRPDLAYINVQHPDSGVDRTILFLAPRNCGGKSRHE